MNDLKYLKAVNDLTKVILSKKQFKTPYNQQLNNLKRLMTKNDLNGLLNSPEIKAVK